MAGEHPAEHHRPAERPLDRTRPLWELYVIEGIDNGRYVAHLNKIHHAAIDGAAGVLLLGTLLDEEPDAVPAATDVVWPVEEIPSELLRITAVEYLRRPEEVVRLSVHAARSVAAGTHNPVSPSADGLDRLIGWR